MIYIPKTNRKSGLTEYEIRMIREHYKKSNSIEKTAKELRHSKITVNKYVRDISSKKTVSRYANKKVLKINPKTGKIEKEYKNSRTAAILCHISASGLSQCLNGYTDTCGGFMWAFKDEYCPPPLMSRDIDIILNLR